MENIHDRAEHGAGKADRQLSTKCEGSRMLEEHRGASNLDWRGRKWLPKSNNVKQTWNMNRKLTDLVGWEGPHMQNQSHGEVWKEESISDVDGHT